MFSNNKNKPVFGAATSASPFNIGTNPPTNQTPFGRSPLFGNPPSGLGTSPPLFAPTTPKPRGLFSGTGRAAQQASFGTNLFNPQLNANPSVGSPLFGSSGYGQQNTGFGFAFATPTPSSEQKGSVVKFSPPMATDMVSQKGVCRSINTKLNCIVCMKEYEAKSQEELRWEDYESNRKGPQQLASPVVPSFGNSPSAAQPLFGQIESPPMFGQVENKQMFGQINNKQSFGPVENKPLFGQPATGLPNLINQPSEQSPFGTQFGQFGLTSPATKPFGFAAASPSTFGGTAGDKPFAFTATSPTFSGNPFGSPPVQNTFNASTPVTAACQPLAFGSPSFGQANTPAQNTGFFNKPAQPMFNFSQTGQSGPQTNLFQPSKPAMGLPSFGTADSGVNPAYFGKTGSSASLPSGKIEMPNFNFGQQAAPQPVQSPFGAVQSPAQLTMELPSAFGTQMTNNFTNLHKPMTYGTEQNRFSMAPNYGLTVPQQQQLASPFQSEQPDSFYTIVDNVYESFPYRSVFDGIPVKLYMDEDTTNPRMLNKIMEQESLPITSTNDHTKLRMLTGPEERPNAIPHKCRWLEGTNGAHENLNNFALTKKSGKRLTFSKDRPTREQLLKKLSTQVTDENVRRGILEQLKIDAAPQPSMVGKSRKSNSNPAPEVPDDAVTVSDGDENSAPMGKEEELISLLLKQFIRDLKDIPGGEEEECNNDDVLAFPRKSLQIEDTVEETTSQNITPRPKAESPGDHLSDTEDTNSKGEELPSPVIPPSAKSSLKALLTIDQDLKTGVKTKSLFNRLKTMLEKQKITLEPNGPLEVGDHASAPISPTCGIKLTRKDYYTIPPLEDIRGHQNEKGDCLIKGFTVGRHGFGNVYFPDETNISNLDLDEIIHFHFHEAVVYPDDRRKPPLGQGLNRPGQVTLERVWPRHPITRKILRDPKDIEAENFVKRLTLLSRKQEAVFVDYRADTGSWVFRVEHFSKFSFTESDDEEVAKELEAAKLEREARKTEGERKEASGRKGLGGNVLAKRDDGKFQEIASRQSLSQAKLSSVYQESTNNVMVLKCSFFDGLASSDMTNADLGTVQDSFNPTLSASTNRNVATQRKTVTCPPKYVALLNRNRVVPKGESLIVSSVVSYMDAGLFMGRSFRTGWGPGFSFITRGPSVCELNPRTIVNGGREEDAPNTIERLKVGDLSRNPRMMYLKEHLEVVFAESKVSLEPSPVPLFTVNENHRSLICHQDIAESIDMQLWMGLSHYRQVWNLCLALWGPKAITPTNRRELFSKWLEDVTLPFLKIELKQSATIKNIFVYLSGHRITEAAELAEKERLPNLSVLIAQSSGQESSKQLLRDQLEQWNNTKILDQMDKDVVKIYMLLAGVPFLSGINVCEGLDWKRALAVYFWYVCPAGTTLTNAVRAYQSAFESGLASPPTPEGYECTNGKVYDVLYQIMMLFVNPTMPLEKVVNPLTYTNDPLDYRLSWFLLQVFTALKVGTVSQQVTNSIHASFSSQLEHLGLWEWSVFVLLFIKDESYKTNAVMNILEKNLDPGRSSRRNITTEDFLVNRVKIPSEWIHSVLATKTNLVGNYLETYQHLILAKNWCRARELVVERVIPDFIINGQWKDLSRLLERLIPGKGDILHWDTEVGLVLDYLNFTRKIIDSKGLTTALIIRQLKGELAEICFRVQDFPTTSPKQRVAAAELSISLVNLLKLLYCELEPTNTADMQSIISLVKVLTMPPDYKQGVLREICSWFFKD